MKGVRWVEREETGNKGRVVTFSLCYNLYFK